MSETQVRPGRYKARIFDKGAAKSKTDTFQVGLGFSLEQYWYAGNWHDWTEHGQQIYGYFHPIKKDGQLNETACDQLVACGIWDGLSLKSLETDQGVNEYVQIVVDNEMYEGKQVTKVKWMDPANHVPGIKRMASAELQTEANRFDHMLRARYGASTPAPQPAAKPNGPPKQPPANKPAAPRPTQHRNALPSTVPGFNGEAPTAATVDQEIPF